MGLIARGLNGHIRHFRYLSRSSHRCTSGRALFEHPEFGTPLIKAEEEKFIQYSPYDNVDIPKVTLTDYVWDNLDKFTDRDALVCGMTGRSYTYGMTHALSQKFGSALIRNGAKKGDVLGLVVPNIPEFVIAYMGAASVGVTLTTMNPTYRPEEIARQLENSGARYVMTIGLFLQNIKQACEIYKGIEKIIVIGMEETPSDCMSFMEMAIFDDGSYFDKRETIDPEKDILTLPYSSGTTGPPKGVALTHSCIVANLAQVSHPDIVSFMDDQETQHTSVAVLPFFHIFGMTCSMSVGLRYGARLITLPKFEPEMFINSLVQYKPSHLVVVPPLVSFLSSSPLIKPSYLSTVKMINGGASTFGPTMIEKFMSKCPGDVRFQEGYGMTETSPVTHVQPKDGIIFGSCGNLVPNTVAKIVDIDSGKALGPGENGELCVSGPQVMKGYFNNKKATSKIIHDGWLHTGDIAYYNEEGHFFIVDRLKELIKVKGLQVAPSELEDLIRKFPGVDDVAVVGVPDERCGELPRAYVVRKNRSVMEQDIIDFVTERVAPHKKLGAGVMFVDTLPKNQTGKVLRRELKAQVFKGSFGY